MKSERYWGVYRKDVRLLVKRGYDLAKLYLIIEILHSGKLFPASAHPHKLGGEYAGFWECHIESDWLLIYKVTDTEILLARTGTHADLFK